MNAEKSSKLSGPKPRRKGSPRCEMKVNTSSFPVSKVFSRITPVSGTSTLTRYWLMIPFGCRGFFQVIRICVASTSASCKSNIAPGTKKNE